MRIALVIGIAGSLLACKSGDKPAEPAPAPAPKPVAPAPVPAPAPAPVDPPVVAPAPVAADSPDRLAVIDEWAKKTKPPEVTVRTLKKHGLAKFVNPAYGFKLVTTKSASLVCGADVGKELPRLDTLVKTGIDLNREFLGAFECEKMATDRTDRNIACSYRHPTEEDDRATFVFSGEYQLVAVFEGSKAEDAENPAEFCH